MLTIKTLGSSSKGNCYSVGSGEKSLLVECGLPWRQTQIGLNFKMSNLSGCLCSHIHSDHFKSYQDFMKAGIDVYAHEDTWWAVNDKLNNRYTHRKKTFEHGQEIIIDDYWKVLPFAAVHDVTCSGFVISEPFAGGDRLCFLTDTAYCRYKFPKINIFMIEANFSEAIMQKNVELGFIDKYRASRVFKNHMSIERVIDFLKANDLSSCREIRLLHGSDSCSDSAVFKRLVQEQTGIPTYIEAEA